MPVVQLRYQDRNLRLFKPAIDPDLNTRTILVEDQWDYVEMWLKRNGLNNALFFWRQAEDFAKASKSLPHTSSPLTRYYSAMNAVKALLVAKGIAFKPYHGLAGANVTGAALLADESVTLMANTQIAPALCRYMGEAVARTTYSLEDILYNLPYIHRAFTVTFPGKVELFLPISDPRFVRIDGTTRSYFACTIVDRPYQNAGTVARVPGFEHDIGVADKFVIRRKARFAWDDAVPLANRIIPFKRYYQRVRRGACYIKGSTRLWYLKMDGLAPQWIDRSSLTLTYMALHRLSELSRYTPEILAQHFDSQHNWLLSEFINLSLDQFIDEISAELTGHEFMPPGIAMR